MVVKIKKCVVMWKNVKTLSVSNADCATTHIKFLKTTTCSGTCTP